MECQGCGHNYPSTITRCTRCGELTPRRGQSSSGSRLIEFPRRPQSPSSSSSASQPAWKAELTERVRAARAKRDGARVPSDQYVEEVTLDAVREREPIASRPGLETIDLDSTHRTEPIRSRSTAARMAAERPAPADAPEEIPTARSGARANDQIVEAALLRAQRASENASRIPFSTDTLSQSSRSASKAALAIDKEATARALEPAAEVAQRTEPLRTPTPQPAPVSVPSRPPEKELAVCIPPPVPTQVEPRPGKVTADLSVDELPAVAPIDDIEPRDYLSDEIKKVDRELNAQFAHNESPILFAHILLNVVDFVIISLSVAPFLALIVIYNGNLFVRPTQIAGALVVGLVSFFYLALTQCLCGKTFGMMLTNTRIVDSQTFEPVTPARALIRSAGYYLATLPAFIGILWFVLNRKRRGWHDYISGTMVARDF